MDTITQNSAAHHPLISNSVSPLPPASPQPHPHAHRPLTHFTLFPQLPSELRLKIWSLGTNLPPPHARPRLITVRTLPHDDCAASHRGTRWCPRYSTARPPPLAHVCSEARMVVYEQARRAGHLCFGSPGAAPANVFLDPSVDRLYLPVERLQEEREWRRRGTTGLFGEAGVRRRTRRRRTAGGFEVDLGGGPWVAGGVAGESAVEGMAKSAEVTTTLEQFLKCHQAAKVRFLVVDWEGEMNSAPREDSVLVVMRDFPGVEDLVFVVREYEYTYTDFIAFMERTALDVGQEKARWARARKEGNLTWEWPVVRMATMCRGGLKFVELDLLPNS